MRWVAKSGQTATKTLSDLLPGGFLTLNPILRFTRAKCHHENLRGKVDFCTRNYINQFKINPMNLPFLFCLQEHFYFFYYTWLKPVLWITDDIQSSLLWDQRTQCGQIGVDQNGHRPTTSCLTTVLADIEFTLWLIHHPATLRTGLQVWLHLLT